MCWNIPKNCGEFTKAWINLNKFERELELNDNTFRAKKLIRNELFFDFTKHPKRWTRVTQTSLRRGALNVLQYNYQ